MKRPGLALLLVLAGCSPNQASRALTGPDWTNGAQPCSVNHLSFRDGKIAFYPGGKDPLVMYRISSIDPAPNDSGLFLVKARPTEPVVAAAARKGLEVSDDYQPVFAFRVAGNRLSLEYIKKSDDAPPRDPGESARYFDAVACPA